MLQRRRVGALGPVGVPYVHPAYIPGAYAAYKGAKRMYDTWRGGPSSKVRRVSARQALGDSGQSRTYKPKRRRRRRKGRAISKRLKKYVKRIAGSPKEKTAYHDFREITGFQTTSALNEKGVEQVSCFTPTGIEANITNAIYHAAGSAGRETISGLNTAKNVKFHFKDGLIKMECRNNNAGSGVFAEIYTLMYKNSTAAGPKEVSDDAWDPLLLTAQGSATVQTDPRYPFIPPSHSTFHKFLKVIQKTKIYLGPGAQETVYHKLPNFFYNPDEYDQVGSGNVKGTVYNVIVTRGCVSHDDTTTSNVGYADTALDIVQTCYIKYGLWNGGTGGMTYNMPTSALDAQAAGPSVVQQENPGAQEKTEL